MDGTFSYGRDNLYVSFDLPWFFFSKWIMFLFSEHIQSMHEPYLLNNLTDSTAIDPIFLLNEVSLIDISWGSLDSVKAH